jgi:hypothetical protein
MPIARSSARGTGISYATPAGAGARRAFRPPFACASIARSPAPWKLRLVGATRACDRYVLGHVLPPPRAGSPATSRVDGLHHPQGGRSHDLRGAASGLPAPHPARWGRPHAEAAEASHTARLVAFSPRDNGASSSGTRRPTARVGRRAATPVASELADALAR